MQTQNLSLSRVYFLRITIEIFSMDNEPLEKGSHSLILI
jgi:hypothetical protein